MITISQFEEKYTQDVIDIVLHFQNDETLIGTIGIMPYSAEIAVLKKFFVYEGYQGKPNHVGKKLYDVLLAFVKEKGYKTILLDTPHNTKRAHKFYEKAGFREVKEEDLPIKFSHPYKDCDFFLLEL